MPLKKSMAYTIDYMDPADVARATARILLDIGAVNFRPEDPYRLTSGRASPSYIDCRKIISFPDERREITKMAVGLLDRDIGRDDIDVIAGGETAGIPFAAWIAAATDKPMVYVRKKPKGFGRMAQIEGDLDDGTRVLLVEDLATDAGSKIAFCEALRSAGATVNHCLVVFHYGIFPASFERLAEIGVALHGLATWWDVLAAARTKSEFSEATLTEVESFLRDPERWSEAHGGASQ
ncbi:MAG: orotate phosphoribosyltransferase [Alphaproteobacteria bacterium]|nr:orotate phosphoribosyltransferase [Alphaproteobacteria bacterium]